MGWKGWIVYAALICAIFIVPLANALTNPYTRSGSETDHSLLVDKHEPALADVYAKMTPATSIASAPTFTGEFAVTGGHAYISTGVTGTTNWKQIDN